MKSLGLGFGLDKKSLVYIIDSYHNDNMENAM